MVIILLTLLAGIVIGTFGAAFSIVIFRKKLIADYLQEAFTLLWFFYLCCRYDSIGIRLLVVTIMGIIPS